MNQRINNEWTFWHDGEQWIAINPEICLYADELDDLDQQIISWSKSALPETHQIKLFYDNSRIPSWMRPYMPHYMNRIINI